MSLRRSIRAAVLAPVVMLAAGPRGAHADDAFSRGFTVCGPPGPAPVIAEAHARPFSVCGPPGQPPLVPQAISRGFTAYAVPPGEPCPISPDLIVQSVSIPSTAVIGAPVEISWVLLNQGVASTEVAFADEIILSSKSLPGGTLLLGTFPFAGPIEPGASVMRSEMVILPPEAVGTHAVLIASDALDSVGETNETNNVTAAPGQLLVVGPDLIAGSLMAPASGTLGESIELSWMVSNGGTAGAGGPWVDQVYLSLDGQIDGGDVLLHGEPGPASLEPGASYTRNVTALLPLSDAIAAGAWLLLLETGALDAMVEISAANNLAAPAPIDVAVPRLPNLRVTAIVHPSSADSGGPVEVAWTVTNDGTAAAGGTWVDQLAVSSSPSGVPATPLGPPVESTGPLAPGASYTRQVTVDLPFVAGTQHLLVTTDGADSVEEHAGDADNLHVSPDTLQVQVPDLVVTAIDTVDAITFSQPFAVDWTVANLGPGAALAERVDRVYLSTDAVFNAGDTLIASFPAPPPPLAPGADYARSETLVVTAPPPTGTYTLFVVTDAGGDQIEANEANNAGPGQAVTLDVARPDLVVADLDAPTDLTAGATAVVAWSVLNQGLAPATGIWRDRVFLSTDQAIGNDVLIGDFVRVGPVAAEESAESAESVLVPVDVAPGPYFLVLDTDATDTVEEGFHEANNGHVSVTAIQVKPAIVPDLRVESIGHPTSGVSGTQITITWQGVNDGLAATVGAFTDRVHLSLNAVLDPSDPVLATAVRFTPVPASGGAYAQQAQVTLPALPGTWHVIAVADAGDVVEEGAAEGNNALASPAMITIAAAPKPDLLAEVVSVPPTAQAGSSIAVTWRVTNDSKVVASGSWTDALFLSSDAVHDQGDALVRLQPSGVSGLGAGESYERTSTITIPPSYEPAVWHVIARTDHGQSLDETGELNNFASSGPIAATPAPAADLVAESASAPPSGTFGSSVPVSWTARNDGDRTANAPWSDLVFISSDATLSPDDLPIHLELILGLDLEPGATYTRSVEVDLPLTNALPAGTWFLIVRSDGNQSVEESDDDNNALAAGAIEITRPPLPDLTVTGMVVPSDVGPGDTVTLQFQMHNAGTEPVEDVLRRRIFLSPDPVPGSGTLLADQVVAPPIAPEASVPVSVDLAIPAPSVNTVYFIVCLDVLDAVVEEDEGNNCGVSAAVPVRRPDLAAVAVSGPSKAVAGTSIQVTYNVENEGTAAALPFWSDALALAPASAPPAGRLLASVLQTTPVPPKGTYQVTRTVTIPDDLAGVHVFTATLNAGGLLQEGGMAAANNFLASLPVEITQPDRPNLVVSNVIVPPPVLTGQAIALSWTVENDSEDVTAEGAWIDRVFASTDQNLSAGDELLAEVAASGPLAPGGQYTKMATATASLPAGDYHLIVRTDATALLTEDPVGGEADNVLASASVLAISGVTVSVAAALDEAATATPVTLGGTARIAGTALPAADVPVTVSVTVRGFATTLGALTDGQGDYSVTFQPLPTIGGLYLVDARGAGGAFPGTQDQFVLWGIATGAAGAAHVLAPGATIGGSFTITNLADLPLTGVSVQVAGSPSELVVEPFLSGGSILAPLESRTVSYTVQALALLDGPASVPIVISSDQTAAVGAGADFELLIHVQPDVASLALTPSPLVTNMVVGDVKLVQMGVQNVGLQPSGPLMVSLAPAEFLSLVSPSQLEPLNPGESAGIVLRLSPDSDLPLGPYNAAPGLTVVDVTDPTVNTAANLTFNAVSTSTGDLVVLVVNEFSFYGTDQGDPDNYPQGAVVEVRDVSSGALLASGTASFLGFDLQWDNDFSDVEPAHGVVFEDLQEAYHQVTVTAPGHGTFSSIILNQGAVPTVVSGFLPRQLVSYQWTVVPVNFVDEYLITLQATFETNVPAPVIVFDPSVLDFTDMETSSKYVELEVHNHGFIQADDFHLVIGQHVRYEIIPLTPVPMDIPGMSSITIPLLLIDHGFGGNGVAGFGPEFCKPLTAEGIWNLLCGESQIYQAPLPVQRDGAGCPGIVTPNVPQIDLPPAGAPSVPGLGGPVAGGFAGPPTNYFYGCQCDVCRARCAGALGDEGLDQASDALGGDDEGDEGEGGEGGVAAGGLPCPLAGVMECLDSSESVTDYIKCDGGNQIDCALDDSDVYDAVQIGCRVLKKCMKICCDPTNCDWAHDTGCGDFPCSFGEAFGFAFGGDDEEGAAAGQEGVDPYAAPSGDPIVDYAVEQYVRLLRLLHPKMHVYNEEAWFKTEAAERPLHRAVLELLVDAIGDDSPEGDMIGAAEAALLLAQPRPANLTDQVVEAFIERYNRTVVYAAMGITETTQVPPGMSLDFIAMDKLGPALDTALDVAHAMAEEGFTHAFQSTIDATELLIADSQAGQGICASVAIQLEQTVAITRQAFEATLIVNNETQDDTLEALSATLMITDLAEEDVIDRFFIFDPQLDGIDDVGGGGVLAPGGSATVQWTILPGDQAAPEEPVQYFVSGELSYAIDGNTMVVPLYPVLITVLPNASLELRYFLETVVFGDDPFTPEIEPSVPFALGLLVRNTGAGTAGNFNITTGQPEIIENESGLVIDFDLLAAQVEDQELSPAFNVNLGDIEPDQTKVARWLMVSSLQGEFVQFDAQVESLNGLNEPDFSLIDSLETFDLTHVVRADVPADDGRPDFLVNELLDVNKLPDHLHTSGGAIELVAAITNASVSTDPGPPPTAAVSAAVGGGWSYIRIDDPYDAALPLIGVERSDGKQLLMGYNAWQTDRIRRDTPQPLVERLVHIFDSGGTGSYTLHFDPDGTPPAAPTWFALDPVSGLGDVALALVPGVPSSDPRDRPLGHLVVQFTESIDPDTLQETSILVDGFDLLDQPVDLSGTSVSVTLRLANLVADLEFDPPLPPGARYCVQLIGVRDPAGNDLVGDTARLDLTLLAGDATGDRRVNNTDVGAVASMLGIVPVDPTDVFQVRSDLNLDGAIDAFDLAIALDHRDEDARFVPNPCLLSQAGPEFAGDLAGPHPGGLLGAGAQLAGTGTGTGTGTGVGSHAAGGLAGASAHDAADGTTVFLARFAKDVRGIRIDFTRFAVTRVAPGDGGALDVPGLLADYAVSPASVEPWPVAGGWWVAAAPPGMDHEPGFRSLARALAAHGLYVSPVLLSEAEAPMLVPPALLVGSSPAVPRPWIGRWLAVEFPGLRALETDWAGIDRLDRLTWPARHGLEVLERANAIAARSDVAFCEPDFVLSGWTPAAPPAAPAAALAAPAETNPGARTVRVAVLAGGEHGGGWPSLIGDLLGPALAPHVAVEAHRFGVTLDGPGTWAAPLSAQIEAALAARARGARIVALDAICGHRSPALRRALHAIDAAGAFLISSDPWLDGAGPGVATLTARAVDADGLAWPQPTAAAPPVADVAVPVWPAGAADGPGAPAIYAAAAAAALLADHPELMAGEIHAALCAIAGLTPAGAADCGLLRVADVRAASADLNFDGRLDGLDVAQLLQREGPVDPARLLHLLRLISEETSP